MLQRYDIDRIDQTNRLSIKEFAVLERKSSKRDERKANREDYSLIHEVSYDCDVIRAAIGEGQSALISELRTVDFFPIYPCAEILAKSVTAMFNGHSEPTFEVFFDDRTILSTYDEQ